MTLATFTDLKKLMGHPGSSIEGFPPLEILAESVDAAIASYMGRWIDARSGESETVYLLGPTQMVPLKGLPVSAVTSVDIDGEEYDLENAKITSYGLRLAAPQQRVEVVVVYDGGYGTPPREWVRAALMQTVYEYQNHDHIGADSVITEAGTVNRPSLQLLDEVKQRLNPSVHPMRFHKWRMN